jgi:hypothetical protein
MRQVDRLTLARISGWAPLGHGLAFEAFATLELDFKSRCGLLHGYSNSFISFGVK